MSRRLLMWGLWATTTAVATTVAWAGTSVVTQTVTNDHTPPIRASAVRAAVSQGQQTEVAAGVLPSTTATGSLAPPAAGGSVAPPPAPGAGGSAQGGIAQGPTSTGGSTYGSGHLNTAAPPPAPSGGGHVPSPPPAPAPAAPAPGPAPSPSSAAPPAPPSSPPSQPANVAAPAPAPVQQHDDGGSDDYHSGSSGTGTSGQASPNAAPSQATFTNAGGTVTVTCQASTISLSAATPFDGYSFNVQSAGPSSVVVVFTGNSQTLTIRAHCYNGQAVLGGGGGGDD